MRFRETIEIDHPIQAVKRAYGKRDFFLKRYAELGYSNVQLRDDGGDGERDYRIAFRAQQKVDLPAFAAKILGETQQLEQEEHWNLAAGTGRIVTRPKNAPVSISADVRMVDAGGATRLEMSWEVKAKVPLIGGRIESLAADEIRARMPRDAELSNRLVGEFADA
jgi:carbon monoxide dehydrogenase subunit G